MSNHFPTIPDYEIYGVQYTIQMAGDLGNDTGNMLAQSNPGGGSLTLLGLSGAPLMAYSFSFDTGTQDEGGNEILDSSWFDQDSIEADLATVAGAVAASATAIYGVDSGTAEAAITIARQWFFAPPAGANNPDSIFLEATTRLELV